MAVAANQSGALHVAGPGELGGELELGELEGEEKKEEGIEVV